MTRSLLLAFILYFGLAATSSAQTVSKKKTVKQKTVSKKSTAAKNTNVPASKEKKEDVVSLTSTSSNQAYSETDTVAAAGRRFSIADPTINILNQRANGSNVPVSSSGVVGMPRGAYGFANGKILLRPTTATSSGTLYGSGAVGTGTTIMGVGAGENSLGVNGKNPYAGPWLWGTKGPGTPATSAAGQGKSPGRNQQQ